MNRRSLLQGMLSAFLFREGRVHAAENSAGLRRLRFVLTAINQVGRDIEAPKIWMYLPSEEKARQTLEHVSVSMPYTILHDDLGQNILQLDLNKLAAFGQRSVNIGVDVRTGIPGGGVDEHLQQWLGAEPLIESGAPPIISLAKKMQAASPTLTAQSIYRWVSTNVSYAGYRAEERGALDCLLSGTGDCTEYAALVVALARASGIPGRMVGGYVTLVDAAPKPIDFHDWAELYLEGAWRIVDAQKRHFVTDSSAYIVFNIRSPVLSKPMGSSRRYRTTAGLTVHL